MRFQAYFLRFGLVAALSTGVLYTDAQAQSVTLTLPAVVQVYSGAGANGPANLVSNAVPFAPGAVTNPALVRVMDGATEVAIAARVLATWPGDGSVRALLVPRALPQGLTWERTREAGRSRARSPRARWVPRG